MMTHMCIDTTTRAAADFGFKCLLAHDACATRALSFNGTLLPPRAFKPHTLPHSMARSPRCVPLMNSRRTSNHSLNRTARRSHWRAVHAPPVTFSH